jgi:ATP-dependent DNA helicase RecG
MNSNTENLLDRPITSANTGLSPKIISGLKESGIKRFYDLIWLIPNRYFNIKNIHLANFLHNDFVQGCGKVLKVETFHRKSSFFRKGKPALANCTLYVSCPNQNAVKLTFFNLYPSQYQKMLKIETISFWGKVDCTNAIPLISSPSWKDGEHTFETTQTEYPTINKIPGAQWSTVFHKIPQVIWDNIIDPLPEEIIKSRFEFNLSQSFKLLHQINQHRLPTPNDIEQAKNRLIYHEFFIDHYRLIERKKLQNRKTSIPIKIEQQTLSDAYNLFPYELTEDQIKTVNVLASEMADGHQIFRLIQGDVGCGKTSVALILAYSINLTSGGQVAIMCPTESLALQHFSTFKKILPKNYEVQLLLGSSTAKLKKTIYQECASGKIQILIGTHALLNAELEFKQLSLAVIDEQHRFGVEQRMTLLSKGLETHCVLMTATPIPRTLLIAQYGDLDITTIRSMPKNRSKRSTRVISDDNFELFLSFVKTRILNLKEQAFFVVPAIEEAENLTDLEQTFIRTTNWFPEFNIGKVHGKMTSTEKENSLKEFYEGKTNILVCTSVIEVGIDVPNSSIMTIFNPERFGLSSLHQLRGRVARGNKPGFCFLVAQGKLSENAQSRLKFLEKNEDGFKIAEYDLQNRGGGDIFGAIQSGRELGHKIASVSEHYHIMNQFVQDIPDIESSSHQVHLNKSVIDNSIIHSI